MQLYSPRMAKGTRLEFVAVKLDGSLERETIVPVKKGKMTKFERKNKPVPAGWLVYFPRGHVIRIKDREHLEHYGLDRKPKLINMRGLNDPNSPLGKMMAAQDDAARAGAYRDLEQAVMHMALAKSGPTIMPEQVKATRFVEHDEFIQRASA